MILWTEFFNIKFETCKVSDLGDGKEVFLGYGTHGEKAISSALKINIECFACTPNYVLTSALYQAYNTAAAGASHLHKVTPLNTYAKQAS